MPCFVLATEFMIMFETGVTTRPSPKPMSARLRTTHPADVSICSRVIRKYPKVRDTAAAIQSGRGPVLLNSIPDRMPAPIMAKERDVMISPADDVS